MNAATSSAVIKVRFVDPPKAGKKLGSIKTAQDELFGVWPKDLGLFQPGREYDVEFSERNYQGRTYRTITKCTPRQDSAPRQNGHANGTGTGSIYAPLRTPDEITFVSRALAAGIETGRVVFDEKSLTGAALTLRTVWRNVFGS